MNSRSSFQTSSIEQPSKSTVLAPQSANTAALLASYAAQGLEVLAVIESDPSTFLKFSNMPMELRLKVWHYNFKEAKAVCVEHMVYKTDVNDDSTKAFLLEDKRALPVALHVNPKVMYCGLRPLCAKFSDVFWVEFITLMNNTDDIYDWLFALKKAKLGLLELITKLEVRGTFTEWFFVGQLLINKKECLNSGDPDPLQKMKFASLSLFQALKEINFTGISGDKDWETVRGKMNLEQLKAWIVIVLEKSKHFFNSKTAPTVTFRPFKTFQQVIDE
ncbi:hypothetical protein ONS95_000318 [Cadophora gregata]|uniref:uncharacterized protein n=1 Tax=Cadophora gregata TaxID=51156 RepID=UPI0026DB2B19|nr:uncharacterized protein ONS95_000318 [Cadophora gregata]KAK0125678.1 hypothetical protein ONS96_009511 [Cadophora gregata f. sp. sojae]KAK0128343.1 hypothetical protein ONS95_000318 [Cadophora gregata]